MKDGVKAVAIVLVGVILAGLVLQYGKTLPVISDARNGFAGK